MNGTNLALGAAGALALVAAAKRARREGSNSINSDSTIERLQRAAEWLADDDPDWAEGGCADMSGILVDYANEIGIHDVRAVIGWASRKANAKNGFPHVWLDVGGIRFDPSAYANRIPIKTWVEDKAVGRLAVSGSYLDPDGVVREDNSFRLDALLQAMGNS